jgi:hypothetical protein
MPEQGGELRTECVVAETFFRRWLSFTMRRASLNGCISTNTERLGMCGRPRSFDTGWAKQFGHTVRLDMIQILLLSVPVL